MNSLNWDRLKILKYALEAGSISAAARALNVSQPTVSRQLRALETELGVSLFDTAPEGIFATDDGERLLPLLREMEQTATKLQQTVGSTSQPNIVRITCGSWMGSYLSKNIEFVLGSNQNLTVEILSTKSFLDIQRREADISICNTRPSRGSLKFKRIGRIAYAVYCSVEFAKRSGLTKNEVNLNDLNWATLTPEFDSFSSSKWVANTINRPPLVRCSSVLNLLDAVESNKVIALLPLFAAGNSRKYFQLCDPIQFDDDYGWITFAEDARKKPMTNMVIENLLQLFSRDRNLLGG